MTERLRRAGPLLAFAGLCYLPLLATSPGQVVADTKSYLYLDPGRLLSRAWSMWDPHVGLGTVTHQNIGFLWPMGPYYWVLEQLGAPDWVAQRLWLGSIMFLAGLGVRYLLRTIGWRGPAVAAAVCAYGLTPYVLTIAVRISAILLPYAALPWLIALMARAARTGSWRHPAAFALVVTTVGTSNATSILLVGMGVVVWVLWRVALEPAARGEVVPAVLRTGALTVATNAWWIVGLSVQASHGVPVLRYTESVEVTAAASAAQEVLRGLGYWFFYGDDAFGPWVGPSVPYQTSPWLVAVTFAVPVLGLLALSSTRWRERAFAIALLAGGLTLAVGVHPYADPSPFGRALKAFLHSDVGMAMRSMPRAAPLVVLALAIALGAGVRAVDHRRPRFAAPAAALVILLVLASLPPLWQRTLVPENLRRPEDLPGYWPQAGRLLDERDDGTRVLEVPGADFTSYRWGTTLDPVTPGITDRPMVARELIPQGSAAGWNLLKAFDGRFQANLAETATIAPIARLLRAGDLLVRSDLRYEHYDTPRPQGFWQLVTKAAGLGTPIALGSAVPNVAEHPAPMLDELALTSDLSLPHPPPVAIIPVEGVLPIVTTKPVSAPVVLAGDGEGVVDSAAAGIIDGTELLRYSAELDDGALEQALADGAVLVVTDTNRRRAERWGSIRFTNGYTEPAGHTPMRVDRSDARLPVFPDAGDDARTVAVHRGGITANATAYGIRNEYLPEDRPAAAVDGDPQTAWRTAANDPTRAERLHLSLDEPMTPGSVTFLAPDWRINRWVTRIALRFDGGAPMVVDLDESSRHAPGQQVDLGARTFQELDIEILADSAGPQGRYGGLTSVGFAEVTIGDGSVVLDEVIRAPHDLLRRVGADGIDHPLAFVLTRLRSAPTDIERRDEERAMRRLVEVPGGRELSLRGTARLSPRAADEVIDALLRGADDDPVVTASSSLPSLTARPATVLDGDLTTAWTAAYGDQRGQWIEIEAPGEVLVDSVAVEVTADGRHSVPALIGIEVGGRRIGELRLPEPPGDAPAGATQRLSTSIDAPIQASRIRLVVEQVHDAQTLDWGTRAIRTLPVSVAEVAVGGLRAPAPSGELAIGCRDDLLSVDGAPVPIEVTGDVEAALTGGALEVRACDGDPLSLPDGEHELAATPGTATGIDLDRLVLVSAAGGRPGELSGPLRASVAEPDAAPRVTVLSQDEDSVTARVEGAQPGQDLWLAFGQSHSAGWVASADGEDLGPSALVDGFANGWRLSPTRDSFEVTFRFAPQRRVDAALWFSLLASLVCLGLVLRRPARPWATVAGTPGVVDALAWGERTTPLPLRQAAPVVAGLGALGWLLAGPAVGAAVALLAVIVALVRLPRWAAALVAPLAMAASAAYVVLAIWRRHPSPGLEWVTELPHAHPIAWFAVLALVTDAVVSAVRDRRR